MAYGSQPWPMGANHGHWSQPWPLEPTVANGSQLWPMGANRGQWEPTVANGANHSQWEPTAAYRSQLWPMGANRGQWEPMGANCGQWESNDGLRLHHPLRGRGSGEVRWGGSGIPRGLYGAMRGKHGLWEPTVANGSQSWPLEPTVAIGTNRGQWEPTVANGSQPWPMGANCGQWSQP